MTYVDHDYSLYIEGFSVIWEREITIDLSDLDFGNSAEITDYVRVPSEAEPDDMFTLELAIHSNEDENDLDNNVDQSLVIARGLSQNYLPFIVR